MTQHNHSHVHDTHACMHTHTHHTTKHIHAHIITHIVWTYNSELFRGCLRQPLYCFHNAIPSYGFGSRIYIYIYITPPAQVAQCQDHLGHEYRSGMQQPNAGSTRARSPLRWCPCASCIWLLHPAPILVPKMVLTLRNLRWWCFSFH